VRDEIEDWFIGMERSGELTPFFQQQLRNRGFFDGAIDGRVTPALRQAVVAYRQGVGLGTEGLVDLPLFTRFINAPFPPAPAQPFRDAPAAALVTPSATPTPVPPAAPAPTPPAAPTVAAALTIEPLKAKFEPGEPVSLRIRPQVPSYVFCYSQDAAGTVQRIFPNRFVADARVDPATPLILPGNQGFRLPANGPFAVACLAAPRDVYRDAPAALRWGDFQALNAVRGFGELQRMFEDVVHAPVTLATLKLP